MAATPKRTTEIGPIVSAAHLAEGEMSALSEVEFALEMANNAFSRWMVRGMAAAGVDGLSALDVLVLHTVAHRARMKTVADICLVLNIEDTHTVTYTLKKLERLGLVSSSRRGKEKAVAVTSEGEAACLRYRKIRETLLVEAVKSLGLDETEMSRLAALLRALSGHYDQAARSAVSL
ncbi:winged helix DNA-binding protein [Afifella marina]|uniref:Predicted transcription regulator, contains HTH domain, MarR family n=1 Tax=Afifella marina DSM 2698 TaxID=1120955 RepID=A0A1G5N351_AFIMA|nr:winged helix DNA-binding protein [Afifella marina]MBK1622397.1 transcriptional regulator [Afifella marina DSM 2698]MBK1626889.1 transcriptional regulator [Afifella marina]MBK5919181.1 transcriptional regulator [Afifella marina]RAI21229.1 transcriptional regulator [Afifella marina DSM 2698]SCZ31865.1 Predicted transcription regulator, contains HTH domain, MarR family [Afifella marina DSM 2698]